jgi:hypothetical protein
MLTAGADGELHLLDLRTPGGAVNSFAAPSGGSGKATTAYTACGFSSDGAFALGGTAEGECSFLPLHVT